MEHLWAPWRSELFSAEKPTGCIFCAAPQADDLRQTLVVHKGVSAFVILNKYPYNNGHVMVVPYRHLADLGQVDAAESAEIFSLLQRAVAALKSSYGADGYNIGANLGRAAGAGIDQHLHFHVLPRWSGDSNFMTTVAGTRVIPEALEVTYDRLVEAFSRPASAP